MSVFILAVLIIAIVLVVAIKKKRMEQREEERRRQDEEERRRQDEERRRRREEQERRDEEERRRRDREDPFEERTLYSFIHVHSDPPGAHLFHPSQMREYLGRTDAEKPVSLYYHISRSNRRSGWSRSPSYVEDMSIIANSPLYPNEITYDFKLAFNTSSLEEAAKKPTKIVIIFK